MTRPGDERPMMDHEYDGIQEYDNPMPRWWLLLFAATIVFAVVYYVLPGDMGAGGKPDQMYAKEMAAFAVEHPTAGASARTAEEMTRILADPTELAKGKALFATNCVSCHRADGGGLIGPNLTDEFWIHGGSPLEVRTTIDQGVLAKGMPPWGKMLHPDDVDALTAYVFALRGTHPPNPKPPQGSPLGAAPAAP